MKSIEARKKYFEKYVQFEHCIRHACQLFNIQTNNIKLSQLIDNLSANTSYPIFNISVKELRNHNKLRNWLAHAHRNNAASEKMINDFKKIDEVNTKLTNTKIKKRHPRRGRAT